MKIVIADRDEIDSYSSFADEFVSLIFDVEAALVTDLSDLTDFCHGAGDLENAYGKIEAAYGIDARGTNNLVEIFRLIEARKNQKLH